MNDAYGLYRAGEKFYSNKLEALERVQFRDQVTFHWNDSFWLSQNWQLPSPLPLTSLYEDRVRQLREKYDYLILCYSGGADSWNVLRSFDKANLPIDEIVSYHDVGFTDDRSSLLSREIFETAAHDVEAYQAKHPATIYTLIDSRQVLIDYYRNVKHPLEGYFSSPSTFSHPLRRGHWLYCDERYRKLADSGRRVAVIWGHDKTILQSSNKRYFFALSDNHLYTKRNELTLPFDQVLFYWDPEAAPILIKQCSVVRENLDRFHSGFVDPSITSSKWVVRSKYGASVSFSSLDEWLYPGWTVRGGLCEKFTGTSYLQDWDRWVTKKQHEEVITRWTKILREGYARCLRAGLESSPNFFTRKYYIE